MQMRSGDYGKALSSYCVAIDKQLELINASRVGKLVVNGRMNFILAVRYYLKGLALYQIVHSLYDNNSLLSGRIKKHVLNDLSSNELVSPLANHPERRAIIDQIEYNDESATHLLGDERALFFAF
jgi:hypothetical protein